MINTAIFKEKLEERQIDYSTFESIVDIMKEQMLEGNSVKMPGLGILKILKFQQRCSTFKNKEFHYQDKQIVNVVKGKFILNKDIKKSN